MVFEAETFTGWHLLLLALPLSWQAWYVARQLLKGWWKGANLAPEAAPLVVVIHGSSWRVVSARGRCVPYAPTEALTPPQK